MSSRGLVLFDLDHTLYESYWSWKRPLAALFRHRFGRKAFPWALHFEIRKHSGVFDVLFEKSFRYYWLTTDLAAVLTVVSGTKFPAAAFLADVRAIEVRLDLLRRIVPRPGAYVLAARKLCQSYPLVRSVIESAKELSVSPQIVEMVSTYQGSLRFRPHEGVTGTLDFLQESAVPFYLASEGEYDQQYFKCKLLGLEEYFSGKILASEIFKLNRHYRASRKTITDALEDGSYAREMESPAMQHADEDIRRFELLRYKEECHYYVAALNAIASNCENPELFLKEASSTDLLATGVNHACRTIMVGDRDDKDMLPVWQLLKDKALLIRMRSGKYKKGRRSPEIPGTQYVECSEFRSVRRQLKKMLEV